MKIEMISLFLSIIAILFTGFSFYFTSLRKGEIKMTRPSVIFLGPDGINSRSKKIFIRTLLFSTGQKGNYIQNMYLKLKVDNLKSKIFNIWVYDQSGLKRGSGLFVGEEGISANHHFLLNKDDLDFQFSSGNNLLQVFVELKNGKEKMIYEIPLNLTVNDSEELTNTNTGLYFDWDPSQRKHISHIDIKQGAYNHDFV